MSIWCLLGNTPLVVRLHTLALKSLLLRIRALFTTATGRRTVAGYTYYWSADACEVSRCVYMWIRPHSRDIWRKGLWAKRKLSNNSARKGTGEGGGGAKCMWGGSERVNARAPVMCPCRAKPLSDAYGQTIASRSSSPSSAAATTAHLPRTRRPKSGWRHPHQPPSHWWIDCCTIRTLANPH